MGGIIISFASNSTLVLICCPLCVKKKSCSSFHSLSHMTYGDDDIDSKILSIMTLDTFELNRPLLSSDPNLASNSNVSSCLSNSTSSATHGIHSYISVYFK